MHPAPSPADRRLAELAGWAAAALGVPAAELVPASGDASFRRYFRLCDGARSFIAMDAPPEREPCEPFLDVAGRLRRAGLNAPAVFAQDLARGFLLLSDLGSTSYLQALSEATVDRLYADALKALHTMQTRVSPQGLPEYDERLLAAEMALFTDWFLGCHLGVSLRRRERERLGASYGALIDAALAQPRCFVHRDYHSRNLMLSAGDNPGLLDFQDAVLGPVTYDLVSLLRDCYVAWPQQRVAAWVEGHRLSLGDGTLAMDAEAFARAFDLMGVQRHLKAIGIFARLNYRDGKPAYLADIPRTFGYIDRLLPRYAELEGLGAVLAEHRVGARLGQ